MPRVNTGQKVYHGIEYAMKILDEIELDARDLGVDKDQWRELAEGLREVQQLGYAAWNSESAHDE